MTRKRIYRALPPNGTSFMMSLVRGLIAGFKRGDRTVVQEVDDIYSRAEVLETRAGYLVATDVSPGTEELENG